MHPAIPAVGPRLGQHLETLADRLLPTPRARRILLWSLAAAGYAWTAVVLVQHGTFMEGGAGGIDAWVYWSAGQRALGGEPLYHLTYGDFGSFAYPPIFAQAMAPFSMLPFGVFLWLWRAGQFLCLRIATGSWRTSGIALLVWPPLLTEIGAGNVHLLFAAATARAMLGDGRWLGPASLTKLAPIVALPLGLARDRRRTVAALLIVGMVCLASIVVDRGAWLAYAETLGAAPQPPSWMNLAQIVPLPVRLVAAVGVGLLAVRWVRLAPVAVTLATPVLWLSSLSTLVAVVAPVRRPSDRA